MTDTWIESHWEPRLWARIRKEMTLVDGVARIDAVVTATPHNTVEVTVTTPHDRRVVLDIPPDFPFRPPRVFINRIPLNEYRMDTVFSTLFQKRYDACPCPCCTSVTTSSQWSPARTLRSILVDLNETEQRWFCLFRDMIRDWFPCLPDDVCDSIARFM